MSKTAIWFAAGAATAAVVAALLFLASMRYPAALVDPPLPVPDYGLQAVIAYTRSLLAAAGFVATGVVAGKDIERRGRILVIGSAVIVGVGVLAAVAALNFPTM